MVTMVSESQRRPTVRVSEMLAEIAIRYNYEARVSTHGRIERGEEPIIIGPYCSISLVCDGARECQAGDAPPPPCERSERGRWESVQARGRPCAPTGVCVCVCLHIYVYVCMHAWMDGWMEGWMDGWIYVCVYHLLYIYIYVQDSSSRYDII